MDWQIRIVILVAAFVLVGYIYWDFNKKKKTKQANEQLKKQFSKLSSTVDHAGFDMDGVGKVRTAINKEPSIVSDERTGGSTIDEFLQNDDKPKNSNTSDYNQERCQVENTLNTKDQNLGRRVNNITTKTGSQLNEGKLSEPAKDLFDDQKKNVENKKHDPELVLTLILQSHPDTPFSGKDILPLFLSQGLRHGEMGIFHRHQSKGGNPGPVLFSLANAIAPGTINIDTINSFQTPALALFMTLPGPDDPQIAYNAMVNTARLIIGELGGSIFDENRSVYSEQIHNYRLDKIKEYSF